MKSRRHSLIFILLAALVNAIYGGFAAYSHRQVSAGHASHLAGLAAQTRKDFAEEAWNAEQRMASVAHALVAVPGVAGALEAGVAAAEAGDAAALAAARQRLLDLVAPPWRHLQHEFDMRQLQFIFAASGRSFLRVQAPDLHGDRVILHRAMLYDAIATHQARMGYECGRTTCAMRAVIPVSPPDSADANAPPVAVLEASTSLRKMLENLRMLTDARYAVFLDAATVDAVLLPELSAQYQATASPLPGYYLEATTPDLAPALLSAAASLDISQPVMSETVRIGGREYLVHGFPLRGYASEQLMMAPNPGIVVAWQDIDAPARAARAAIRQRWLLAFLGWIITLPAIYAALFLATRRLEAVIDAQTRQLKDMAMHDSLTGLYNRRYLDEYLAREWLRNTRYGRTSCLILVDLDHFKKINDTHGHQTGDRVLAETARLVTETLRRSDFAFRFGGEEFLLLLPETALEAAIEVSEKIRARLATASIAGLPPGSITASFGIASVDSTSASAEAILHAADGALYAAKASGRNRICVAAGE